MCFIIQKMCFIIQNLCKFYIEITLYYPNLMFIYTNFMFIYKISCLLIRILHLFMKLIYYIFAKGCFTSVFYFNTYSNLFQVIEIVCSFIHILCKFYIEITCYCYSKKKVLDVFEFFFSKKKKFGRF